MKINLTIRVEPKGINHIEAQIEELNLRTEIGRAIEKLGYKEYELINEGEDPTVVLD